MGFKIEGNFNVDNIMEDITSQIEDNPEIFTSQNIGKTIQNICPVCKCERIFKIIEDGKVRCIECNNEMKLKLDIIRK